jgi:hypothetical protein
MNKDELGLVMTSAALRLLDSLPEYSDSTDIVKTVADLGRNKFFRAAQALTMLGEAGAK